MADDDVHQREARMSFGPAAAHYDRVRPTYPETAIRWLLGTVAGGTVVDLGAGTGLLTRVIQRIDGTTVIPVEPDALMRAQLAAATPGVTPVDGSAEAIPLPDGSVDAVLAGQAYHWFDKEKTHAEVARVVRSGGAFAPVWNVRDETVEWVAELSRIIDEKRDPSDHGWLDDPDFGPAFGPVEQRVFSHQGMELTADRLVGLITSRSYYLTAAPTARVGIEHRVRELAAGLPEVFTMPYQTVAYRALRR